MVYTGEEIGVVANLHGQVHFRFMFGQEHGFLEDGVGLKDIGMGRGLGEDVLQVSADRAVHWTA